MKFYLVCSKSFKNNEIFNLKSHHNRDNCLYPYFLLKEKLKALGHDIDTYDLFDKASKEPYALIFHDFPKNIGYFIKKHQNAERYLYVYESPIKNKGNQVPENYKCFKKVFTWNTNFVDNKKIFFVPYSQKIDATKNFLDFKNKKLCTAIFGHKLASAPFELYSERIKAIKWFEKNHLNDFDLYGAGWDRYYFKDKLFLLNRLSFLTRFFKQKFPSYKGGANSKSDIYKNYKFALCYENASFDDYITEKIFDCFLGGCVPIYLGADNVEKFIPADTFIDKRRFPSYEGLYDFIKNMPEEGYNRYICAINKFLNSEKIRPYSAEYFANTITKEIVCE